MIHSAIENDFQVTGAKGFAPRKDVYACALGQAPNCAQETHIAGSERQNTKADSSGFNSIVLCNG